jgi:HAD superfamily hydrolase (TIGR01509 family)
MDDLAAVLFDLDGTLCVDDQAFVDVWAAAFERVDFDPPVGPADVAAVDPGDLPPVEDRRGFYAALYRVAVERVGHDPDPERAAAAADAYTAAHDLRAVSFRAGAEAALSAARADHAVGLVTNGDRETQTAKLEALGVVDAVDAAVFCAPEHGVPGKPDPEPVEAALADLGVDPGRALLVGDDLRADVGAARDAGMRSAWVPRGTPPADPDPAPDHVFDSMHGVADLLSQGRKR